MLLNLKLSILEILELLEEDIQGQDTITYVIVQPRYMKEIKEIGGERK
jgi:hypothetical protein